MESNFDVRMLIDNVPDTNNSCNIGGRMRRWVPSHFGVEVNCNRPDLWETFEKPAPAKFIKKAGKLGIFAGVLALGATAAIALSNKFNQVA